MRTATSDRFGLLLIRVVPGIVFLLHGWQKFNEFTIPGTVASFRKMGVPAAEVLAPAIASLELAGGALLILGLLTRVVAVLLALDMAGALLLVHSKAGFFAADGGYEFVLILAAAAAAVALLGPGRWSLDARVPARGAGKILAA